MKNGKVKLIAAFFICLIGWDIVFPTAAIALTGGPSQPEVQSFEPVGTTEMVDVFSGDFVYNIPLLDVEGFPVNISYHSGVGMDDEASWVGLGWNINPGAVNRNMRGVPDDFKGNMVKSTTNIKKNETWGLRLTPSIEIFGKRLKAIADTSYNPKTYNPDKTSGTKLEIPNINITLGVFYNNYRGLGYEFSLGTSLSLFDREKGSHTGGLGLNFGANSFEGADVSTDITFNDKLKKSHDRATKLSGGLNINSRHGLNSLTISYPLSKSGDKGFWRNYRRTGGFQLNPTSYTPQLINELTSTSVNLSAYLGAEIVGYHLKGGIAGYYHGQFLKNQVKYNYAYGYMYSHDGAGKDDVMFDLNRENDGNYTKGKPFLPMPIYTYDYFNVSGEGTGGLLRPFRGDVGVMHDAEVKNNTIGIGLGGEFGVGNAVKNGLDISGNYGYTRSGPWRMKKNDFDVIRHLGFETPQSASSFEPFYFKSAGERTLANNDIFSTMGGNEPIRIEVSPNGRLEPKLIHKNGGHSSIFNKVKFSQRQKRNMAVNILTNYEADKMALDRKIKLYQQNTFSMLDSRQLQAVDTINREATQWDLKELMSEMTVTNADGRRYVYGIPAYNQVQYDASFRVVNPDNPGSLSKNPSTGLVSYNAGDNSTGNGRGEDNFFNKNELPAYAHSFLLTSVLSADYVDITGNGVSNDDIGTAVKINYSRTNTNYKWRTPYGKGTRQANHDEGLKSDVYDDRGNYIYGEKELWYVHSIESKNYVACFYTSRRADGCQVMNEDGGRDTSASFYKLDSIKLFTKAELLRGNNAVPLKTVHFEYDYSLCRNSENNRSYNPAISSAQEATGKLTLKKIYFTYGTSRKGRTNSYQFNYSNFNPIYNMRGYDRWGNYKPNATLAECEDIGNPNVRLSNADDPYVLQNKDSADLYSSAWSLAEIKLPSGGTIKVNYESDDYAYIQDRQAGQMFKISGINDDKVFKASDNNLYVDEKNYLYLFFDLAEPFDKNISAKKFAQKNNDYFAGIDKMYFKFLMDLTGDGDYEFVTGYADKHEVGFSSKNPSSATYDVGYVKLKDVPLKDKRGPTINPITKATWNFMRLNAPKKLAKVFSNYEMAPGDTKGALKSLAGAFVEMGNMYRSFGRTMRAKGAGQKFVLNKSFIRLNNPIKQKFGGGTRVSQLTLNDSWNEMVSGEESSTYGQKYLYTKEEKFSDSTTRIISSGVAAWEPGIGNDENSLKQPVSYTGSNALAPDDQYMIETPIGEAFFPSPNVGYSEVTTINIKPTKNIARTGTGKVVQEFYTAYDFPVIFKNTDIDKQPKPNKVTSFLSSLLKVYVRDRAFVSQGYSIELNDMHGKPKGQKIYEENNEVPISEVRYEYHYKKNEYGKNQLLNTVDVVNNDGSISSGELGREADYMFETRNSYSFHAGASMEVNLDAFVASIFPILVPSLFSSISMSELEFGSAVNTKVITRYGILKSTEVFENGASVKTHNVLFDASTGDVLLSKTTNEFTDTIYTFNYPAHFAYEGMGQASKNLGYWFKRITIDKGEIHGINNYRDYISPGDEMYIEYVKTGGGNVETGVMPERIWAVEHPHYAGELVFLTRTGYPISTNLVETGKTFTYNLKIIRSGRRNMQSASIGSVVTLENPVKSGSLNFSSVINSNAVEFSDKWPVENKNPFPYSVASPSSMPSCSDSCLIELETLVFPAMWSMSVGDTIRLTELPYAPFFNCVVSQPPFEECRGDYNSWDSLLIYEGIEPSDGPFARNNSEDDIKYASLNEFDAPLLNSNEPYQRQKLYKSLIGNNPFDTSLLLTFHKNVLKNQASGTCDICDDILNPGITDSVRVFRNAAGCRREFGKICTKARGECLTPKVKKYECTDPSTGITQTINGMTVPSTSPINTCGDFEMFLYKKFYPCQGGVIFDGSGGNPGCDDAIYDIIPQAKVINPYIFGTRGNWRPKKSWLFYDKRDQSSVTDIRKDGTYTNYSDFWKKPALGNEYWDTGTLSEKWTWTSKVTKYNRTGNEIENVDALGIYSSAIFGYGSSIVKAVANNSKHRQMAFDGFEDYNYFTSEYEDHFSFRGGSLVDTQSHTGRYSVYIPPRGMSSSIRYAFYPESEVDTFTTDTSKNYAFLPQKDIIGQFSPDAGKYIISGWVKESTEVTPLGGYFDTITIKTFNKNCSSTSHLISSGPVIDGWQRIEGTFLVGDSLTAIEVLLKADTLRQTYFDDIRIHPWQSNMKSFVYHPETLRLVATLDENNYATFYEYDEEGRLIRIKRETERGIVTLQESRTGLKIND